MLARRERETERREQRLALGAGRLLDGRRPCRPGRPRPRARAEAGLPPCDRARGSRSPARAAPRPRATNALRRRARRDCRAPPPRTLLRRQRPWRASRSATALNGSMCRSFALSRRSSFGSNRAGARDSLAKSKARAQLVETGMRRDRIGGADQRRIARHRQRLDPLLAQGGDGRACGRAWTAPGRRRRPGDCDDRRRAASAPSASNSWICGAVLATWSSPRITWVMPRSMSSTTLGIV